jgi:hypothetical protein
VAIPYFATGTEHAPQLTFSSGWRPGGDGLYPPRSFLARRPVAKIILLQRCYTVDAAFLPLRVTGRERRRLVDILARRPDGMTRRELADWLYADDPNGGPENTFAVCQLVHQARLQLAAQGYTIISDRGPGAHYRLAKL